MYYLELTPNSYELNTLKLSRFSIFIFEEKSPEKAVIKNKRAGE
jgi:hypothetical protein